MEIRAVVPFDQHIAGVARDAQTLFKPPVRTPFYLAVLVCLPARGQIPQMGLTIRFSSCSRTGCQGLPNCSTPAV